MTDVKCNRRCIRIIVSVLVMLMSSLLATAVEEALKIDEDGLRVQPMITRILGAVKTSVCFKQELSVDSSGTSTLGEIPSAQSAVTVRDGYVYHACDKYLWASKSTMQQTGAIDRYLSSLTLEELVDLEVSTFHQIKTVDRALALDLFHNTTYATICSCVEGCDLESIESVRSLYRNDASINTPRSLFSVAPQNLIWNGGDTVDVLTSDGTNLAVMWSIFIYESVGVRTVDDLKLLEPWMFSQGMAVRDTLMTLQKMFNYFIPAMTGTEAMRHHFKGIDVARLTYMNDIFSTPINLARFLTCVRKEDA